MPKTKLLTLMYYILPEETKLLLRTHEL